MQGKMSMGARMEVVKPGRKKELLWFSRQRERGLQHGWVEETGKSRGKRVQQGPAEPGEDWEVFSRSSESHAPCEGGNSKDVSGLQGAAGQTGTGSGLGTGFGAA